MPWRHILLVSVLLLCSRVQAQENVGSNPEQGVSAGEVAFFTATTPGHGEALWRSDGTAAGTWLVADPVPEERSNEIGILADVGGRLLFTVRIGETTELWRSDGGHSWSRVLRFGKSPIEWLVGIGGRAFLLYAGQLWVTDGTTAGTHHLRTFTQVSTPAVASDSIYFHAKAYRAGGGLWRSDGTVGGTSLLAPDFYPPVTYSFRDYVLSVRNGDLVRDGGGEPATVIRKVAGLSFVAAGEGVFYFGAASATESPVYRSDGTAAGTRELRNAPGSSPRAVVQERLIFVDNNTLFSIDEGDVRVALTSSLGRDLATLAWGDRLAFTSGGRLGITDGTPEGTRILSSSHSPSLLAALDDRLLFTADDGVYGRELWAWDARSGEVALVRNLREEAIVEGRVIDAATGEPAGGAVELVLEKSPVPFTRSLQLDGEGRFRGEGLVEGEYVIRTRNTTGLIDEIHGGGACAPCPVEKATRVPLQAGTTTRVDFALRRGATLHGRVTHATTGAPIPNARVSVSGTGQSATTDAGGRWTFRSAVPDGRYLVDVDATPDYQWKRSEVTVSGSGSDALEVQLVRQAAISGIVRDRRTGAPVAGADVIVYPGLYGYDSSVQTAADGRFRIHVRPGTHVVRTRDAQTVEVRVAEEQNVEVELAAEGAAILRGRVVDGRSGQPIAGATVTVRTAGDLSGQLASILSDAEGRYSFSSLPRGYAVRIDANASGYRTTSWPDFPCDRSLWLCNGSIVELRPGRNDFELEDLRMAPAPLRGRVTTASGAPIGGVTVNVHAGIDGRFVKTFTTNAEGVYTVDLPPDTYLLVFSSTSTTSLVYGGGACAGKCDPMSGTVLVLRRDATVIADVVLRQRPVVEGRVVDARTGEKLQAAVTLRGPASERVSPDTPGLGFKYLLSGPGEVTAFATVPGYMKGSSAPVFVDWDERKTLDIALDALTTVSGRVTDAATGVPMANVDIGVMDRYGALVGGTRTDFNGRYTAGMGSIHDYYVFASERIGLRQQQFWRGVTCEDCRVPPPDATPLRSTTPLTGIDFALSAPKVSVTFSFTLDGAPLAGAGVELFAPGQPHSFRLEGTSNALGKLTLDIPAGAYHVRSWNTVGLVDVLPGGISCPVPCDVALAKPLDVLPGSSPEVTLALRRAGASDLVPRAGARQGGERARLYGAGFRTGVRVLFGGNDAAIVGVTDQLDLIVPPADVPGPVEVVVVHPDGTRETLPGGYHYGDRCTPLHAEVVQTREGEFVTLHLLLHGGTARTIRWYDGQPGAPLLTRIGHNSALIVPLDRTQRRHYTVRVVTECEDLQFVIPIEPIVRRRPAH